MWEGEENGYGSELKRCVEEVLAEVKEEVVDLLWYGKEVLVVS